jgi:hypothetical protein
MHLAWGIGFWQGRLRVGPVGTARWTAGRAAQSPAGPVA